MGAKGSPSPSSVPPKLWVKYTVYRFDWYGTCSRSSQNHGGRVQLQQVVMNLMLNGIEAMKETGGVLTFHFANRSHGSVCSNVIPSSYARATAGTEVR
jgi:signal transduction histidine kinase